MNIHETHKRTIAKTVAYRISSTLAIILLAKILGANSSQAISMGVIVFFLGSFIYYVYDRVWAKIDWRRSDAGNESRFRSLTKTVGYRIITGIIAVILAKLIMTDSTATAISFAVGQIAINIIFYYALERLFDFYPYGKVLSK